MKRKIENTQKLLAAFRGNPDEFTMLKGVLCSQHVIDAFFETHFDGMMIAARMDELNRVALSEFVATR